MIENPNTILITNEYYPSGLTEGKVHTYYQENKKKILDQTKNRNIMLFLQTDNGLIVKRKSSDPNHLLTINSDNYDKLIHGRVISIHSNMKSAEDFGIIDIDCDDFDRAKIVTGHIYDYIRNSFPKLTIRFTGKTSFHIICPSIGGKVKHIEDIKTNLNHILISTPFKDEYTVSYKRTTGIPNLDLAPNKFLGGFITLHSLSIIGLKCMEVSRKDLNGFNPNQAKI